MMKTNNIFRNRVLILFNLLLGLNISENSLYSQNYECPIDQSFFNSEMVNRSFKLSSRLEELDDHIILWCNNEQSSYFLNINTRLILNINKNNEKTYYKLKSDNPSQILNFYCNEEVLIANFENFAITIFEKNNNEYIQQKTLKGIDERLVYPDKIYKKGDVIYFLSAYPQQTSFFNLYSLFLTAYNLKEEQIEYIDSFKSNLFELYLKAEVSSYEFYESEFIWVDNLKGELLKYNLFSRETTVYPLGFNTKNNYILLDSLFKFRIFAQPVNSISPMARIENKLNVVVFNKVFIDGGLIHILYNTTMDFNYIINSYQYDSSLSSFSCVRKFEIKTYENENIKICENYSVNPDFIYKINNNEIYSLELVSRFAREKRIRNRKVFKYRDNPPRKTKLWMLKSKFLH